MANTTIQIKRSSSTDIPASLAPGELAFSYVSNTLFVGNSTSGIIQIALATNYGNSGGGGSGTPGGSATQVQYNGAGAFAGSPGFTFTVGSNTVNVGNAITFNTNGGSINSTVYSGTSNNATYLGGLTSSAFLSSGSTFANAAAQDATISGTYQALNVTLATTGVVAGAYGNTTSVPTITVDAKGRITSVSNNTITLPVNTVNTTGNFTMSGNLNFTGVNTFFSSGLYVGAASVNSTYYTGTSANATLLNSQPASYYTNASNITTGTLPAAQLPYTMNQNVSTTSSVTFLNVSVTNNLIVYGNTTTIGSNNLSVTDNMIYLNSNSTYSNPDLGFAANYNDGIYHHTGFFRDHTTGTWKVFDNYLPEPDASQFIDQANVSFHVANFQANIVYVGNTTVYSTVNTTNFTGTSNNSTYLGGLTSSAFVNTASNHANSAGQDVIITGTYQSLGANLKASGVTAGGYGSTVNAISIVVDAQGRVTSIANAAINVNTALGYTPLGATATFANSAAQDVQIGGTYAALTATLATTAVTAGSYGNSTFIPSFTVDAKGRLTNANTTALVVNATYVQNTDSRTLSGNLIFSSTLEANGITNGAVVFSGGVGIAKNLYANGSSATAYLNNANVMSNIGVTGISYLNNANVSGLAVLNTANVTNSLGVGGKLYVTDATTSSALGTGAVQITGGLAVSKDVVIGGNLTVSGTTTLVNSNTVSIGDSLIKLAANNTATDTVDIGFYGVYGPSTGYAGLARLAGGDTIQSLVIPAKAFVLFANTGAEPTTIVGGSALGTLAANLLSSNVTFTTALSVSSGGTGATTFTANGVILGNGTSAFRTTSTSTDGQVLLYSSAANGPVFSMLDGGTF
jgi:hypothetical protein